MPKCPYPIRSNILEFEPYSPGLSIDEIRKRFNLENVIKLASNENPLGTPPLAQSALQRSASSVFRYAQSGNPCLTAAIAKHHSLRPESVVTGNGSDEVIDLLVRVCPTPGVHSVVISKPSFSLYRLQSKLCGVAIKEVPLKPDFSFDWDGLAGAVDEHTALVFVTMPDNPSGYCPPAAQVTAFLDRIPPACLVVLDEAYADFITDPACSSFLHEVENRPNLVVLRTFSKSYGLAGLRLGFGVMDEELAACLRNVRPPFSVNILAEKAGIAALEDSAFRQATMEAVHTGREWLDARLKQSGCRVYPSQSNFIMFALPEKCPLSGKEVFERLLAQGVIIRPLDSYGLPGFLRVSIGTAEENAVFIQKLETVLAHA